MCVDMASTTGIKATPAGVAATPQTGGQAIGLRDISPAVKSASPGLEEYLQELQAEARAVEERIAELKAAG